jgi:hypothetical protein
MDKLFIIQESELERMKKNIPEKPKNFGATTENCNILADIGFNEAISNIYRKTREVNEEKIEVIINCYLNGLDIRHKDRTLAETIIEELGGEINK